MTPDELSPWIKRGKREPYYRPHADEAVALGPAEIARLIPHRDPFAFVDAITAIAADRNAIAGRIELDAQAPLFRGHFPDDPIFPGVLQLEAIGQLALCLLAANQRCGHPELPTSELPEGPPRSVRALKIHHALFLGPVRPPGSATIVSRVIHHDDWVATCAGQVITNDGIASLGILEVYFVDG